MARPKGSKPKSETIKKKCYDCSIEKPLTHFYKSNNAKHEHGVMNVCKECSTPNDIHDLDEVRRKLYGIDRPFINELWTKAIEEVNRRKMPESSIYGIYLKNIQMRNSKYEFTTWKDSDVNTNVTNIDKNKSIISISKSDFIITDDLIDKWGDGYSPEEYRSFERKYSMLKNNYPEKTAMHTEALVTYIRYRVKEELATAQGDSKAAKEWGTLAKDAATAAKINPSQLSKSDLSDGLDTFGQLVRTVEQAVDIIPILPKFKERPQDKVDFTIWCYVNYIRDLKGLPLVEYEEIYQFYEARKKEYENKDNLSSDEEDGDS